MKRIIIFILTLSMLAQSVIAYAVDHEVESRIFNEDFEDYSAGDVPDSLDLYSSTGAIAVEEISGGKALNIVNKEGFSITTVEKSFATVEKKSIKIALSFMQKGKKSNENTVVELLSGDNTVIALYADNGGFYVNGVDIPVMDEYSANKWYNIEIECDLYDKTAEIKIDGATKHTGTIDNSTANKIRFISKHSPGFYIDDINIVCNENLDTDTMVIDGNDKAVIPNSGDNVYEYILSARDTNNEVVQIAAPVWSIVEEGLTGVELTSDINGARLRVLDTATAQNITLRAALSDDETIYAEKTIALENVSEEELWIVGENRIAGKNGTVNTYESSVRMRDQNGDEVSGYGDFRWSITGVDGYEIPSHISVDENTGKITVKGDTPWREFIMLRAEAVADSSVFATKKILVTDMDSYVYDTYRYDAVVDHVNSALEAGHDIYNDTPMIADLINLRTRTPGDILLANYEVISPSNMPSQSNLMRTMVNLSNFEKNDYYRDYVYELYDYWMENNRFYDQSGAGGIALIGGGHSTVDLKIGQVNQWGLEKNGYVHETKGGTMCHTPMFWVDENEASMLLKMKFLGHAGFPTRNTLAFGRHWYYNNFPDETTWTDRTAYQRGPNGAIMNEAECTFLVVYGEMFNLLAEFYKNAPESEKENILYWGEMTYDTLDKTGYNPITGEYNGMFNEMISSHNPAGGEAKSPYGDRWYNRSDYATITPGDRWYDNVIIGMDGKSWVDRNEYDENGNVINSWSGQHQDEIKKCIEEKLGRSITDEECKEYVTNAFLEPYMFCRENSCINRTGPGLLKFIDVLPDDEPLKATLIEKYTNSIYNYLNLRYDEKRSYFDAKMSWGLDFSGWSYPHNGYYGTEGQVITGKVPEDTLMTPLVMLVTQAKNLAASTSDSALAEKLDEQADYIWSVIRNIAKNNYDLGDIGDPFNGEAPDLKYSTTQTSVSILKGVTQMYRLTGDEEHLKLACVIANNLVKADYKDAHKMFTPGEIFASSSHKDLPVLLELEAVLLDRYEELIELEVYIEPTQQFHEHIINSDHGDEIRGYPLDTYPTFGQTTVRQSELNIEPSFEIAVGESRKIEYTVMPYDASTSVTWDVSDPEVAQITDDGTIVGISRGKVKVRCVSGTTTGLASDIITVEVK